MNMSHKKLRKRPIDDENGENPMKKTLSPRCYPSNAIDFSTPEDVIRSFLQGSTLTPSQFFEEYWEKKPLIIPGKQTTQQSYPQLFSLDTLKRILDENKLKFERDVSVCRYVKGRRENLNGKGTVGSVKIEGLISKKNATVQFHQPQRFQDSLWRMCSFLECYFQCLVGANVYITPGGSQGLAPHYDDVEVFILQLEGKKHWRLYPLPEEASLPRTYSRDLDAKSLGKPIHDFVLKTGDLMYFPRGTVHQADTPKDCHHSTHITISTYQHHTWGDVFMQTLPSVVDQVMNKQKLLRKGLPITPCQPFNISDHKEHIQMLMMLLADGYHDNSSALFDMQVDFVAHRLPPYHTAAEELERTGEMPLIDSCVRLRFPEYVSIVEKSNVQDGSDDDEEAEEEDEEYKFIYVYHALQNRRVDHMIGADLTPIGLKFTHDHADALHALKTAAKSGAINVQDLQLAESKKLAMLISMWTEGLLEVVRDK